MAAALALGVYLSEEPRRKKIRTEALGVFLDNNRSNNFLQIGISEDGAARIAEQSAEIERLRGVITKMRDDAEAEDEQYCTRWNEYQAQVSADPSKWSPNGPFRCSQCGV